MSRSRTRNAAVDAATGDDELVVEPDAAGPGVREWLASLPTTPPGGVRAAAFDTRIDAPAILTGRASKAITTRCATTASPRLPNRRASW